MPEPLGYCPPRTAPMRAVAWLAFFLAGCMAFGVYRAGRSDLSHLPPFERWDRSGDRRPVAEALIADELLIGMSRRELVRRLGTPGYESHRGQVVGWRVGVVKNKEWDFGLYDDHVYLEVELAGDTVTDARIFISPH